MNKNFKNKNLKAKRKITKTNKGITLIALIITIIVLLILAVVAIRAVTGDGILAHAKNARDKWEEATANEEAMLGNLTNYITDQSGNNPATGDQPIPMAEAQNEVLSTTENKKVEDEYGNIVVVPAGFKIVVDETTNNANHATDGIVIEDVSAGNQGSQFVWVPVGTVYTDKNKTEDSAKKITFGRYGWSGSTGTVVQSATEGGGFNVEVPITSSSYNYTEKLQNSESKNVKAKDIVAFCTSVSTNGGYYIGRYEAGDSIATSNGKARTGTNGTSTDGTLVCKKEQYVYNWITQPDASAKCQAMYSEEKPFTSDLVNSYAWDTAIIFIQQCGTEPNASTYASLNKSTKFGKTGENNDQYRNINDMSGNDYELTTETYSDDSRPCTFRGGYYDTLYGTGGCASYRGNLSTSYSDSYHSFRPLLYL